MAKRGVCMKITRRMAPHLLYRHRTLGFLRRVIPDNVWQRLAGEGSAGRTRRVRWTPRFLILVWLAIGLSGLSALTERFLEGYEWVTRLLPARRRPGQSYQGLLKATGRVGSHLLHRFWEILRPTAPRRAGRAWTWYGWTVLAVDGSRFDAPRSRANQQALPCAGRRKTGPQWWVTWLVHLPTLLVWDWRQGPGRSSERRHLRQMLSSLPPAVLLLADAGYVGYDLMNELTLTGTEFLIRCAGNTRLLIEGTVSKIMRQGDVQRVYLWPRNKRGQPPLMLRLLILKEHGRRVYLLTNVMEPTRLSRQMASVLYRARWGVELAFRSLKRTLDRYRVLSKKPHFGSMELAAYVLALALLMLAGAAAMGARVVRLCVAKALRCLRLMIEALRWRARARPVAAVLRAAVRDAYERHRPKHARDWPRPKEHHPPGPPKFHTLTPKEIAAIHRLLRPFAAAIG